MDRYVRDEELIAEAIKATRRVAREASRPTGTEKNRTTEVALEARDKADDAVEAVDTVSRVPGVVSGLTVVSNVAGWGVNPEATVTLSWSPVTVGVDGGPVDVFYELFDGDFPAWSGDTSTAAVKIVSGATHSYRVRAVTAHGVPGDLSDQVTVTGATPALVPLVPKVPTLTSSVGVVVASWSGEYTTPASAAALNVRVEARVAGGVWKQQGAPLTAAGDQAVSVGSTGDTVEVRLVAVDRLNRVTGTSAVASIVVTGVAFTDFDDLARERIEGIEAGQVVIGRTVDGLNRTFTSEVSPGRGFLGFENLAPAIVGSGTWAEVRRNRITNPSFETNMSGWSSNPANTARTRDASKGREGSACARMEVVAATDKSWIANAASRATVTAGEATPFLGSVMIPRAGTVDVIVIQYNAASGGTNLGTQTIINQSIQADTWVDLEATWTPVAGTTHVVYQVGFNNPVIGDVWFADRFASGTPVYFDGSSPQGSVDPDMRTRWLGEPNASESVMEIERVRGFIATRCIAGVSTWEEKPAVRAIPTDSDPGYFFIGGVTSVPSGGTALGTIHLRDSLTGPLGSASRIIQATNPLAQTTAPPNAPGSYPQTLVFGERTTSTNIIFNHGGNRGSGDVWWTDIGLYAGELPTTAIPFHNGDQWYRLETRNGELVLAEINVWDGQNWAPHNLWIDSLAAANSVTARTINMDEGFADKFFANEALIGRIKTNHIDPAVGGQLNLSANETIVLIAGRQDQQDNDLAGVQEQVDTVAGETEANAQAAADAAAQAAIADGKALVAQAQAQDTSDRLNTQQAVFRVTPTGADVASKDGTNIVRITPTGVAIVQGGTPASTWDAGRLIVSEAIVSRAQLGNHVAEKQGGRTTFRPL